MYNAANFILLLVVIALGSSGKETNLCSTQSNVIDLVIEEKDLTINQRQPKKLLRKLHEGGAFIAGLKLGSYLAKKGFDIGEGSFSSAHTFQLFGKSVSSALSLSYGGNSIPLPAYDSIVNTSSPDRSVDSVVQVTVIENPSDETLNRLQTLAKVLEERNSTDLSDERKNNIGTNFKNFIDQHNSRINELNRKMFGNKTRINSKF